GAGPLHRLVAGRLIRVRSEIVAEQQVPPLPIAPGADDVDLVGADPALLTLEIFVVLVGVIRPVFVAQALDRVPVELLGSDLRHRDLDVDDRLGTQTWYRRRADMVDAKGSGPQGLADPHRLGLVFRRPPR